jgi:hypothetical protein
MALLLYFPITGNALDFSIDVSPNIVNVESERDGEIRIFTNMRYSSFDKENDDAFIYINEAEDSIENIRVTRDSRGNLILKFDLEELLDFVDHLMIDSINDVKVVLVIDGYDHEARGEVYIADKKGK